MALYRFDIRGLALGQQVQNTFFYSGVNALLTGYDTAAAPVLAAYWRDTYLTDYLSGLSVHYFAETIRVTGVNMSNESISPFPYELAISGQGAVVGDADGAALCAILAFRTNFPSEGATPGVPKRSYIAYGPLGTASITLNQGTSFGGVVEENILTFMTGSVFSGGNELIPYRIGTPSPGVPARLGVVEDAVIRPKARWRDSRAYKATG